MSEKQPEQIGENPKDRIGITKPSPALVPASAIIMEAMAFADGARKYGAYNWRSKRVNASVYVHAALRHLLSWFDGEESAQDSGVHHLAHARACLAILLDAQHVGAMHDDRPLAGGASDLIAKLTSQK